LILFDIDPSEDLADFLIKAFRGQKVFSENVITFVEDETPFMSKHARSALKYLEQNELITVNAYKMNGTKRRKGYFAQGTIINLN
jgi:hypothetical protein